MGRFELYYTFNRIWLWRDLALQTTWRYQPGWHRFMLDCGCISK